MLTHGASHRGAAAVPPIRVGVGGHRPRRTFQLALIRSSDHARGTLEMSGALRIPLTRPRYARAPSPRKRGEGCASLEQ
jgi:hypothetical protein